MSTFQAKYGGNCGACGERIHKDDWAKYMEDNLVHADCEDVQPERKAEVCISCWLTKPCECDDEAVASSRTDARVRGGDAGA